MKDRYLFRAKRIVNGEWIIGNLIDYKDGRNDIAEKGGDWMIREVDPSTVCQCTGRKDKCSNLIFEHDIVGFIDGMSTENGFSKHNQVGEVIWDEETLSFQVTERLSAESYEVLGGGDCKVIGNIFDNPELLEQEW